jgi:hypothetical protein
MVTLGELLDQIATKKEKLFHLRNTEVKRQVQYDYYRVCEQWVWRNLRREMSVTLDGTAVEMPSGMCGQRIFAKTDSAHHIFFPRDEQRRDESADRCYIWYISDVSTDADATGLISSLKKNTNVLTATASVSSAYEDEYLVVDGNSEVFQISSISGSDITLDHQWRGETIENDGRTGFSINPAGQVTVQFEDPNGEVVESGDITIWYAVYPPQLREDKDIVLVPPEVLRLKVLSSVANGARSRNDYLQRYQSELQRAIQNNQDPFVGPTTHRVRTGSMFSMDKNLFTKRGSLSVSSTYSREY